MPLTSLRIKLRILLTGIGSGQLNILQLKGKSLKTGPQKGLEALFRG